MLIHWCWIHWCSFSTQSELFHLCLKYVNHQWCLANFEQEEKILWRESHLYVSTLPSILFQFYIFKDVQSGAETLQCMRSSIQNSLCIRKKACQGYKLSRWGSSFQHAETLIWFMHSFIGVNSEHLVTSSSPTHPEACRTQNLGMHCRNHF